MLRNPRKGWIAGLTLIALLEGSWLARLAAWLGLPPSPPSRTAVWESSSAHIDPNGEPKPTQAGTDDSAHIDPNGRP